MESKFRFLKVYRELYAIIVLSEKLVHIDANSSLAKSRLFSEKLAQLIWDFEKIGSFYGTQSDRVNDLFLKDFISDVIRDLFDSIRKSGNKATHVGNSSEAEAIIILKKCYQLARWFYETYEDIQLDVEIYVLPPDDKKQTIDSLEERLGELEAEITNYQSKIEQLNTSPKIVEERKLRSFKNSNNIGKSEAETRDLIDEQLRQSGWECDTLKFNFKTKGTVPQKNKNIAIAEWPCGEKWADYALFVGTTLYGLVEAKKFASDISTDLHQSKIYAAKIKSGTNFSSLGNWNELKVPFLFSTNGRPYLEQIKTKSGVWFLDVRDERNHARALRGWFSPQGLLDLYSRDVHIANERLEQSDYDYLESISGLGLRYYQIDAIKAVEHKMISQPDDKRSLLVMATGTGKTRTTIGLVYRFIKSDRFKRVLFLTDRRLLAIQAMGSFKDNKIEEINTFSNIYKMEELKAAIPDAETRLHFATVQSMVKRLFYSENEPLPIDSYDCIIIDEAHRGYNLDKEINEEDLHFKDENDYVGQYKRVIEYFDAYLVGLTATPALHTTEIFGHPVHNYSYREAVIDGFLVDHEPPYLIKTQLSEEGILWEKGEKPKVFNPETNEIEELAELEDELHIEIEQFNKMVITESFNRTVIKQLVKELDPESDEKTLIFAVRDSHADLIVSLLFEEFEAIGVDVHEEAIKKLTGSVYEIENLTKRFKNEKFPNIVVTVDLLTTGIDIPQITNIVFMRRVRSRILFEQMMGRATRLCPEIDKQFFRIFDAVRVYEALEDYTQMKTVSNPSISFQKLVDELNYIETPERAKSQIEQIIAKIQRKRRRIDEGQAEQFMYFAKGETPEEFLETLRTVDVDNIKATVMGYTSLWQFLDERIFQPKPQLVSEHTDEYITTDRGYGKVDKPADYIEGFKNFIEQNRNTIIALQTICTRPAELDRKSLRELKILLDSEGYNELKLSTAWKNAKNQELAADIISFIRTLALDTHLVSHEDRIKNAVNKVRALRDWNKIQLKWIERFEAQLLKETVLSKEDLNEKPFSEDGGYNRLNKIFENNLDNVLAVLNENLYTA
jgi:type I restriction enzyme R subunit